MCTLSDRISLLALVTPVSGLPWSSSTISVTLAPPSSPLCSSRYIWKPFCMSVPSCAKIPVFGAMKPMRNSSAAVAGAMHDVTMNAPAARHFIAMKNLARFMTETSLSITSHTFCSDDEASMLAGYHRRLRGRSRAVSTFRGVGPSPTRPMPDNAQEFGELTQRNAYRFPGDGQPARRPRCNPFRGRV